MRKILIPMLVFAFLLLAEPSFASLEIKDANNVTRNYFYGGENLYIYLNSSISGASAKVSIYSPNGSVAVSNSSMELIYSDENVRTFRYIYMPFLQNGTWTVVAYAYNSSTQESHSITFDLNSRILVGCVYWERPLSENNSVYVLNNTATYGFTHYGICFRITGDNITLDCRGNYIDWDGAFNHMVYVYLSRNVMVKNCIGYNFGTTYVVINSSDVVFDNMTGSGTTTSNWLNLLIEYSKNVHINNSKFYYGGRGVSGDHNTNIFIHDSENVSIENTQLFGWGSKDTCLYEHSNIGLKIKNVTSDQRMHLFSNNISFINSSSPFYIRGNNSVIENVVTYRSMISGNWNKFVNLTLIPYYYSFQWIYSFYMSNSYGNTIESSDIRLNMTNSHNNTIRNSTIHYLNVVNSSGNVFRNNRLNDSMIYVDSNPNEWSSNMFLSYYEICPDKNCDGFCDEPYVMNENNKDNNPLAILGHHASCGDGVCCKIMESYSSCFEDCSPTAVRSTVGIIALLSVFGFVIFVAKALVVEQNDWRSLIITSIIITVLCYLLVWFVSTFS